MLSAGYFRIRNALPGPVWTYPISYVAFHTYSIKACIQVYSFIKLHIWNYICWPASYLCVRITIPCNHGLLAPGQKQFWEKSYLLSYLAFRWNLWKPCLELYYIIFKIFHLFSWHRDSWRMNTLGLPSLLGRSGPFLAIRLSRVRMTSHLKVIPSGGIYWCCFSWLLDIDFSCSCCYIFV